MISVSLPDMDDALVELSKPIKRERATKEDMKAKIRKLENAERYAEEYAPAENDGMEIDGLEDLESVTSSQYSENLNRKNK